MSARVLEFSETAVRNDERLTRVLTVFGTRPEAIKLAPIIVELESRPDRFKTINVISSQHTDLLHPFVKSFGIRVDHDLKIMTPGQTPNEVCARVLTAIDPILRSQRPNLLLVQGDTTTALAGALAAFHSRIPVGHVEAGLRTGRIDSPYPEEMNRRLISRLASFHFAATEHNCETLLAEGVPEESIFLTGNPVVDALHSVLQRCTPSRETDAVLESQAGRKMIVLTTHRREAFGGQMAENLKVLREFIARHDDVSLVFPVHPNPEVVRSATQFLGEHPRIHLISPLGYEDFVVLLSRSWLIVSDSGGVQEEAPTLGKPLLILRDTTERPEAVDAGVARLVGGRADVLESMLEEVYCDGTWAQHIRKTENPFGRGDAAKRIVEVIAHRFNVAPSRKANPTPAIRIDGLREPSVSKTLAKSSPIPVSVIVPCFDEEEALPALMERLDRLSQRVRDKYALEFVFVDDGSRDRTWNMLQHIAASRTDCTLIRQRKNSGIAAAVLAGLREAHSEVVCSIDCDCSYDPFELVRMIPRLTADVDMVTASPYHQKGGVLDVPEWRLKLSKTASWMYRLILRHKLACYTSCFRVYRRSRVQNIQISEQGYAGIAEMLGRLDLAGGTIVEFPTVLRTRTVGHSKMKVMNTTWAQLRVLSRLVALRISGKGARRLAPLSANAELPERPTFPNVAAR